MFSINQHFGISGGAVGDDDEFQPARTYASPLVPSENITMSYSQPEVIDPVLLLESEPMQDGGESGFQNNFESTSRARGFGASNTSTDFRNQATVSRIPHPPRQQVSLPPGAYVRPQNNHLGEINDFYWNNDSASLHQPQVNYPTLTLPTPTPSIVPLPIQFQSSQYTHIQSAVYGSDSPGSWDPLHSSDYSSSQRTFTDSQPLHTTKESPQTQPPFYTDLQSAYISTRAPKVKSLPDDFGSAMAQKAIARSYISKKGISNDSNGASEVSISARKNIKKRHMKPEQRANAKIMRKVGNCIRCKIMRISCDQGNPCKKCCEVLGKARTYLEPCYRENLDDASIIRQGNSEFDQDVMSFRDYQWNSVTPTKSLRLRWILPGAYKNSLPELFVECQQYVPRRGDVTAAQWQDNGRVTVLQLPTYACHDNAKLLEAVNDFLDAGRKVIAAEILDDVTDELDSLTFREAFRIAQKDKSSILLLALRIRANTIIGAGCGTPVGGETLGIAEIVNAAAGHIGDRPLPPALDHQIDVAIWENLRKDQELLIRQLKHKLFGQTGRKPWLEIFLTFFVSLSNVQYVHGRAMAWMNSQRETEAAVTVTYQIKTMIERWNHSAMNILHHFRSIFRGDAPLVAAEKDLDSFVKRENLDSESSTYVRTILKVLSDQGESLLKQTMGSTFPKFTESGDHWTRQLFMHQYQGIA